MGRQGLGRSGGESSWHEVLKTLGPGPCRELTAPESWVRIDFLSDVHLDESHPATLAAFVQHLQQTTADAVFLLGDIFEVWVGDDAAQEPGFEQEVIHVLRGVAQRKALAFLPGNRDFLFGTGGLLQQLDIAWLDDPCTLHAFGQRWVLSHGDEACVDDEKYQQFRRMVRQPHWQSEFLQQPLAARRVFGRQARQESQAQQQRVADIEHSTSTEHSPHQMLWADVDHRMAQGYLVNAQSHTLIHGHTHRPAVHDLGQGMMRWVLSDWEQDAATPRGDVLVLTPQGLQRHGLSDDDHSR